MTRAPASVSPGPKNKSLLCVGNGGLVVRDGACLTHHWMADFLVELAAHSRRVCFCQWHEPMDDPLARTALRGTDGLRVEALAPLRGGLLARTRAAARALRIVVREVRQADFVYLFWPGRIAELVARLCRIFGKPYALYVRGVEASELSSIAPLLSRARFVIAAGAPLRDLARLYCDDVECVTPMTPVRPWHVRRPPMERVHGPWRLLFVGRIELSKGVHELVDACGLLAERGHAVELTMIGHCEEPQALLRRVPPALAASVYLLEAVTDFERLAESYRGADLFVLPSHTEGFPRVLYEAMAFGLPIVTTFVGSVPGTMQDEVNCLRVAVGDAGDLAAKLERLIADCELRSRIALGGHDTIVALMREWHGSHAAQVLGRLDRILGWRG